jgi:hypothetical protein
LPAFGLALGIVLPWVSPGVQLVPASSVFAGQFNRWPALMAAAGALAGLGAGAALGFALATAWSSAPRFSEPGLSLVVALALVGAYLGWQAALSVALATSTLSFLAAVGSRLWGGFGRISPLSYLWVCTLGQILLWRRLSEVPHWPGHTSGAVTLLVACAATTALAVLAGRIMVRRDEKTSPVLPEAVSIAVTPGVVAAVEAVPVAEGAEPSIDTP